MQRSISQEFVTVGRGSAAKAEVRRQNAEVKALWEKEHERHWTKCIIDRRAACAEPEQYVLRGQMKRKRSARLYFCLLPSYFCLRNVGGAASDRAKGLSEAPKAHGTFVPFTMISRCRTDKAIRMNRASLNDKTQTDPTKMYTTLDITSDREVLAAEEASAITSRKTPSEKSESAENDLIRTRPSLWHATEILLGFAGVFAVIYLLGAAAFGVALLYYTFCH